MPCRADGLGMGVLAALLVRNPMFRDQAIRHRKLIYGASLLLLIAIFLIASTGKTLFNPSFYGLEYSVLALFYTLVLLIVVTDQDLFPRTWRFFEKPLLRRGHAYRF